MMTPMIAPDKIILHHSATPDGPYLLWRGIRQSHVGRGWNDIGYHYGVERIDKGAPIVMLGRSIRYQGAHTRRHNVRSIGICVVGDYEIMPFDDRRMAVLASLVADLCFVHGLDPEDVFGHRDFTKTLCPGKHLYARLPEIRAEVARALK